MNKEQEQPNISPIDDVMNDKYVSLRDAVKVKDNKETEQPTKEELKVSDEIEKYKAEIQTLNKRVSDNQASYHNINKINKAREEKIKALYEDGIIDSEQYKTILDAEPSKEDFIDEMMDYHYKEAINSEDEKNIAPYLLAFKDYVLGLEEKESNEFITKWNEVVNEYGVQSKELRNFIKESTKDYVEELKEYYENGKDLKKAFKLIKEREKALLEETEKLKPQYKNKPDAYVGGSTYNITNNTPEEKPKNTFDDIMNW